jgi:hypothetical protein
MTKKIKLAALLLIIMVIIAAVGVYGINHFANASQYTIITFDYERAFEDQEYFSSLGPRLSGTDEEYQGAIYIKNQFEEAGLGDVRIEDFRTILYEVNDASISLIEYLPFGNLPNPLSDPVEFEHKIDFVVQGYSGSYPWSGYSDDMEIMDIGDGDQDTLWEEAQGKAAVISQAVGVGSNTHLFFKAADYDVGALVLHNTRIGEQLGYNPISKSTGLPKDEKNYPEDIPFFMVSKDVGNQIKDGAYSGMKLRMDFDVTVEERDFRVVLGDVKGSENPAKYVMLGAHHDTVYNGDGAVDNTVGTVTIIELARQLVKYKPKKTIRLATWGGEEEGLFGSIMWYEANEEDVQKNLIMYLNFDMNHVDIERGNVLPISVADNGSLKHMNTISKQLVSDNKDLEKYDIDLHYNNLKGGGSDQLIFAQNEIKVASCWGSGSWEYHTYLDSIDRINAESLSVGGRIFGSYALYLANR